MDDRTQDELAGVVDLFGGLTRDELADALLELAFKRGQAVDAEAVDDAIGQAVHDYYLVEIPAGYVLDDDAEPGPGAGVSDGDESGAAGDKPDDDEMILVPGPVAFPTLPEGGEDLPHILDAPRRSIDRDVLGASIVNQLQAEADADHVDGERAHYLIDVTYDAEAWASIDLGDVRDTLESCIDGGS